MNEAEIGLSVNERAVLDWIRLRRLGTTNLAARELDLPGQPVLKIFKSLRDKGLVTLEMSTTPKRYSGYLIRPADG